MEFDLRSHTLFLTIAGSRAYGTHTPTSDIDVVGFCLPPKPYRNGFLRTFEQTNKKDHLVVFNQDIPKELLPLVEAEPLDGCVYNVQKFFKLAVENNPNILDVLFADPRDVLICHPLAERIREVRHKFLSTRISSTFRGYAVAQIKKIERHYKWLRDPPTHQPTRVEFGLNEHGRDIPVDQMNNAISRFKALMDSWAIDFGEAPPHTRIDVLNKLQEVLTDWAVGTEPDDLFNLAAKLLGFDTNFLELMDKERRYKRASYEWKSYQQWLRERNPARAVLEAKFGYDTKHGMHLVRLLQSCREILATGDYQVRRPNAQELVEIRNGAWTYEQLLDYAKTEDALLEGDLKTKSVLPRSPDSSFLDDLCCEIVEAQGVTRIA